MSDVYVDIRLKLHTRRSYSDCNIVSHDLEDALAVGDAVCQDIRELPHYKDLYGVEVVRVGKVNKIDISVADDFLVNE